MQDYHKLRVWRCAVALAVNTRRAAARLPRRGYASLKDQLVSAAESIVFTIVEGCGASTQRELARFLDMAIKSSMELQSQFEMTGAYRVLPHAEWSSRVQQTIEVRRQLCSLRKRVLAADPSRSISHRKTHDPQPETHHSQALNSARMDQTPGG